MRNRGILKAWAFAVALAAGALVATAAFAAGPSNALRVCADPDNLPFSKAEGSERGLYVDLAELVGKQLDRPIEYVWWYTQMQRRALRNTILQDACDAVFALPANADYKVRGLKRSQPFLQVGYAVVAAPTFAFKSLDELKPQRIAVQYGSTPQIVLATLDGFRTTTFRSTEEALGALAKGEVDVAFLWGPAAGYENKKTWAGRWRVTPVAGHDFAGGVAVAVRAGKDVLAADIDRALAALAPQIAALADQYGFPRETPLILASTARPAVTGMTFVASRLVANVVEKATVTKAAKKSAPEPKPEPVQAPAAPVLSEAALAGRVQFNDRCSHCHGTDGYSPVRERDVRFLKMRYSEKWQDTATTTINNGRPDAGMPAWKEILKEADVQQIASFLASIQK